LRQQLSQIGTILVIVSGFIVALTVVADVMLGLDVIGDRIPFMIIAALIFILGGSVCFNAQLQHRSLLITAGLAVIGISLYLIEPFIVSLFALASGAVLLSAGFVGRHKPPDTPFKFDLANDWHFRNARGDEQQGSLQAATFVESDLVVFLLMWNKAEGAVKDAFSKIRKEVMEPRSEDITSRTTEIHGHEAKSFMGTSTDGHYFEVFQYFCERSNTHILLQISSQAGEAPVKEGHDLVTCHGSSEEETDSQT
jgi:hypothetical protein